MSISLYFDEDVHPSVARILSERAFDILTTQEAAMLGNSDEEQLERAANEKRAILLSWSDHANPFHPNAL